MRRWLLLVFVFASCNERDKGEYMASNGYVPLQRQYVVAESTIGPSICWPGYSGEVWMAYRLPLPEENCFRGTVVNLLVCCRSAECYHIERDRQCLSFDAPPIEAVRGSEAADRH